MPSSFLTQLIAIILIGVNLRPALASIGPLLKVIQQDNQLTAITISLLTTLPVLLMGLGALFAIKIRHVFGEKHGVTTSLMLISIGYMLRLWGDITAILIGSSIIIGIGIAMAQALIPSFIKGRLVAQSSRVFGFYTTAIMAGAVAASIISPWLLNYWHWNIVLASWILLTLPAIILWTIIPQHTISNKQITTKSLAAFTFQRAWLLGVFFGLCTGGYTLVLAWLPPYYMSLGWTAIGAGTILAIVTLAEVVAGIIISLIINRFTDRRPLLFIAISCLLIGLIIILYLPLSLYLLASILLGLGIGALFPLSLIITMDHISTPQQANELGGFVQGIGYLIAALFPLIAGIILQYFSSLALAWIFMGIISIILLIMAYTFTPASNQLIFK